MKKMRRAFTQIELIFVMVVIGILASIAIQKLAATRDDAELAKNVSSMATCLTDAYSKYTATGNNLVAGDSKSCDSVICYTISYGTDGLNFVVTAAPNAAGYCAKVIEVGGHLVGTYQFKGTSISL